MTSFAPVKECVVHLRPVGGSRMRSCVPAWRRCAVAGSLLLGAAASWAASPFDVRVFPTNGPHGAARVAVVLSMPPQHYVYADQIAVRATGATLVAVDHPKPHEKHDPFTDAVAKVYDRNTTLPFEVKAVATPGAPWVIHVEFQGCNDRVCFMPEKRDLSVSPAVAGAGAALAPPSVAGAPTSAPGNAAVSPARGFTVVGTTFGYMGADEFLAFLAGAGGRASADGGVAAEDAAPTGDSLRMAWERRGWLAMVLAILLGGLALNLTPCVLPMIPINIAIIGAGARGGSRARGFAMGGLYGLGIALAYGGLGLVVVLTGSKFGALNSSPLFNLGISALFAVMAAAMFGWINVDLSRFQAGIGGVPSGRRGAAAAFALGAVAALLAGACVAPVLISVLLLATDLQARGNALGLALPFLLGAGMALPWPFAGAGLAFLPKPGRWMEKVKVGFGILIVGFAVWYGLTGLRLLRSGAGSTAAELDAALAAADGRTVLVDFWATWCKNCHKMEATTFQDPRVAAQLRLLHVVKFQAENPRDTGVKAVMDRFGAIGLPTYVLLKPAAPGP
jgi:thiol:disulfide interchange protein DsbD